MPLRLKCHTWFDLPLVGDMCYDCLKFIGLNVDKMQHLFSSDVTPIPITTASSHHHSTLNSEPGRSTLNVLKSASNTRPLLNTQPVPSPSAPPDDSGLLAHFWRMIKEKCVKSSNFGPRAKRAKK
ncbi:hypothetical protein H4Q26_012247 [Puccinia striiformis f. sp. tritici PST-130]|nr:hypothetical protein H4Q26_012247 [Puccinia striiformis f. sp. tritici PST-130]